MYYVQGTISHLEITNMQYDLSSQEVHRRDIKQAAVAIGLKMNRFGI